MPLLDFSGDRVELTRLHPISDYAQADESNRRVGIVVDTETTGLDHNVDAILEISLLPFTFDQQGRIGKVLPPINMLNDPGVEITREITRITGITAEDVKGQKLNAQTLATALDRANLIVAHNASFDRKFVDRALAAEGLSYKKPWVCSVSDVNWKDQNVGSAKLDYLAYRFGYYFDAHRAEADCRATLHLLAQTMPDERTVLSHCFSGLLPRVTVHAWKSRFETKDKLRGRGYQWDSERKVWWREIPQADADEENEWLKLVIYNSTFSDAELMPVKALERFS